MALGTSLPELMASVVAARKGHQDLAIGNVVGSSIFNIFFVLSSSAIVAPLAFADANITDAVMVVFATFGLFVSLFAGRKHVISKRKGALLVGLYFAYMLYVILRG